ncbi:MAG: RNA methyltransferase [Bacteroidales bacterium]
MRKLKITEMNRISKDEFKDANKLPLAIVLDNVRSLNNIGSVFRSSDAYRVDRIYLCGITATPPNAEIHKTALGAEDSVEWVYVENTLDALKDLKNEGYVICSIEQCEGSTMLNTFQPDKSKKYAVIFGNEVKGVQQDVVSNSDVCLELPQYGTKHSLNVSVTAGIVIWDFFCKLGL